MMSEVMNTRMPSRLRISGSVPTTYDVFSEVSSFSTDMHIAEVITFSYYFSLQNKSASSLCPLHMPHVKKDPSVCEIVYMESDLTCVNCRVSDDG